MFDILLPRAAKVGREAWCLALASVLGLGVCVSGASKLKGRKVSVVLQQEVF